MKERERERIEREKLERKGKKRAIYGETESPKKSPFQADPPFLHLVQFPSIRPADRALYSTQPCTVSSSPDPSDQPRIEPSDHIQCRLLSGKKRKP